MKLSADPAFGRKRSETEEELEELEKILAMDAEKEEEDEKVLCPFIFLFSVRSDGIR